MVRCVAGGLFLASLVALPHPRSVDSFLTTPITRRARRGVARVPLFTAQEGLEVEVEAQPLEDTHIAADDSASLPNVPPQDTEGDEERTDAYHGPPPELYMAYDGDAIAEYYRKRPKVVSRRIVEAAAPIGVWIAEQRVRNITRLKTRDPEKYHRLQTERGAKLRAALTRSKSVTFIKYGQALALRPDIVKVSEWVAELEKLQDEVGSFPDDIAMDIIRRDLGVNASEVFEFENGGAPVASASIGQVYKARIKPNAPGVLAENAGRAVAVKVQRPEAREVAALDMYILRVLGGRVKKWKGLRTDLLGIADEFGKQLFDELNYRQEAKNCKRFKELYAGIEDIVVPDVVDEFTSERVLTMEWIEGEKGPWEEDGARMLAIGLECSVLQVLKHGFLHADPHRGNLLRTEDGRLAYLDFGMMANVSSDTRYALIGTVLGLQSQDLGLVAESLVTLGFLPGSTDLDNLLPKLNEAFRNATAGQSTSTLNFTRLNTNLNDLAYNLPFQIPPFFTLIARTLTIYEGLARYVDADFKLIRGAYPYIAAQILDSDDNPDLQKLLARVLVTPEGRINWVELERLLSIAASTKREKHPSDDTASSRTTNATVPVSGAPDQEKLREAGLRADLDRRFGGNGDGDGDADDDSHLELNSEVVELILSFVLSDRGTFLREPLINELLITMEDVSVASRGVVSALTNGFVPKPREVPDEQRLRTVWKLFTNFVKELSEADDTNDLQMLRRFPRRVLVLLAKPENTALAIRLGELVKEVSARLVERQAVSLLRSGFKRLNDIAKEGRVLQ